MSNKKSLINGKAYSWNDISVNILGRTLEGNMSVKYASTQEKENVYGRGKKPVSRSKGKEECEASLTVSMKEYMAIKSAVGPFKKLTDIKPFPVNIVYIDEDGENRPINVTLLKCEFTGVSIEVKTGDGSIEIELPLIIADIIEV